MVKIISSSLTAVKPQPMPLRKPMKRLAATLKRAAIQMKLSRSDGETTNQAKLVKSSSLQDSGVLMSSEVTYKSDTTQQEAFLDKGTFCIYNFFDLIKR